MTHAEDLVIAEPLAEDGPGYYGVAPHAIDGEREQEKGTPTCKTEREPGPTRRLSDPRRRRCSR